jgi:TfoX/Sxy family transcriptional regulator of competence genes
MAYDEKLEERIREVLKGAKGVTSKKMFGGVAFMRCEKMFVGIMKPNLLLVRVGAEGHEKALAQKHAKPMKMGGKTMVGFICVAPEGVKTKAALAKWIKWGKEFVATLPAKKKKK